MKTIGIFLVVGLWVFLWVFIIISNGTKPKRPKIPGYDK